MVTGFVKFSRYRHLLSVVLFLFCLFVFSSFGYKKEKKLKVVATTSLISSILQEVGEDKIEIITIVPPAVCPGHFDIKPKEVEDLAEARLFLEHGFEKKLFTDSLIDSVKNSKLKRVTLDIKGNWMVPTIYITAIDRIVEVLSKIKPEYSDFFKKEAAEYKKKIAEFSAQIKKKADDLKIKEIKIVCSKMQVDFLKWMGFKVIATYDREENTGISQLKEIIEKAKKEKVKLVVDNLQTQSKLGACIAHELGVHLVVLTNFPKEFSGKFSYLESLKENVSKIFKELE